MDIKKQISTLLEAQVEGTEDLYSQIPYFFRTRLSDYIDKQAWKDISVGCERGDETSHQQAGKLYCELISAVDDYIKRYRQMATTHAQSDNCALLVVDANRIRKTFGNDVAKFAKAMSDCIEKEKELMYMHQCLEPKGQHMEDMEHMDDSGGDTDEGKLQMIENLAATVEQNLLEGQNLTEELVSVSNISRMLPSEVIETFMSGTLDPTEDSEAARAVSELAWRGAEVETQLQTERRHQEKIIICKKEGMMCLEQLIVQCTGYVENLTALVVNWRSDEAKRSVLVGPEVQPLVLYSSFSRFGKILSVMGQWFQPHGPLEFVRASEQQSGQTFVVSKVTDLETQLQQVEQRFFEINLVVTVQPRDVMSIENKGAKKEPNYHTKRTHSFTTAVRILGGEFFHKLEITDHTIELVAEKDLARKSPGDEGTKEAKRCLTYAKPKIEKDQQRQEIVFKDIKVDNFSRVEQNNVYKQFFRIRYTITVSLDGTSYTLQTLSLPFMFNTGSNQLLEHIGARMWYCANAEDLYDIHTCCPESLPINSVISMLNKRVMYISKSKRELSLEEKEFLKSQLPNTNGEKVTMQGFIKDKMRNKRNSSEELPFSFYTWFHAVMYSIESTLSDAWLKGVIYGFCSDEAAEQKLMNREVPEGTFLLRPSNSHVKNTSSKEAAAALTMEIKMHIDSATPADSYDSQYHVKSVPLFLETIQSNTLYGTVKGILYKNKSIAKFLYGKNKKVEYLRQFGESRSLQVYKDYKIMLEKIETFNLTHGNQTPGTHLDAIDTSGPEPSPRKRKYTRSQSSTSQASSSSQGLLQTSSTMVGSSSEVSGLPDFNRLPLSGLRQDSVQSPTDIKPGLNPGDFSIGFQVQGHRSGIQASHVPGTIEVSEQEDTGQQAQGSHYMKLGGVAVDLSQIMVSPLDVAAEVIISSGSPSFSDGGLGSRESTPGALSDGSRTGDGSDLVQASQVLARQGVSYSPEVSGVSGSTNFFRSGGVSMSSVQISAIRCQSPTTSKGAMQRISRSSVNTMISSDSTPSPTSMQAPVFANLPTVLSDAAEPKKPARRRGGSGGNRKKTTAQPSAPLSWGTISESSSSQSMSEPSPSNAQHVQRVANQQFLKSSASPSCFSSPHNSLIYSTSQVYNCNGNEMETLDNIVFNQFQVENQLCELDSFYNGNQGNNSGSSPTDSGISDDTTPSPEHSSNLTAILRLGMGVDYPENMITGKDSYWAT